MTSTINNLTLHFDATLDSNEATQKLSAIVGNLQSIGFVGPETVFNYVAAPYFYFADAWVSPDDFLGGVCNAYKRVNWGNRSATELADQKAMLCEAASFANGLAIFVGDPFGEWLIDQRDYAAQRGLDMVRA